MNGRISNSLPPIAQPLAGGGGTKAPVREQDRDEFASILEQLGSAGPGPAEIPGRSNAGDDASAAEVFNAHGFFDRVETTIESKRASVRDPMLQPDLESGARFVTGSERHEEISTWRAGLTAGSIDEAMPQRQAKSVLPARRTASPTGPGRPADLRGVDNRAATASSKLHAARAESAERPRAHSASQSKMAFRVLVDNGAIHIAGPARDIAPDEEARLIEQVAELLVEHGLSLSDVQLNGRPLALLRRNLP